MRKTLIFILVFAINCIYVQAQILLPIDSINNRIWQQTCLFPNEKIHLHTDRSVYAVGDTIWFRAYLVNALDNKQESASRYVYSELIDPFGKNVCRVKIKQDKNSFFYGYLPIDDEMPSGQYIIRAYTRYMENAGEEFFFHKPIHIVSPLDKSLSTQISFEGKPGQKYIRGSIKLTNNITHETIPMENIDLYDEKDKIDYWTTDKQVIFKLSPAEYKHKVVKLQAANYQQYLPVSLPANDYQVDFLPEGGNLPAGVLSRMAFKALNTSGFSEEITGIVKDETGQTVCSFQTTHAGMGSFNWIPEAGKKYYAECISKAGVEKRFVLPAAETNTCTLNVQEDGEDYHIFVLYPNGIVTGETHTLLIHQRGFPLFVQPFRQTHRISIGKKALSPGIIQLLLLSSHGQIISERQVFVQSEKQATAHIQTDKETYTQREKVRLDITLQDEKGKPVQGNFSLAVTDNADVLPDSSYTIYTSLLLSSDLKGYIEDPGWYFRGDNNARKEELDLLMLTQGWRKYNVENALTADYKRPSILPETSQRITGSVKRLVGNKAIANAKIQIHIPTERVLEEIHAGEVGRFEFDSFEFPDSTIYNIQATTKKNGKNVLLSLDPETFPEADQIWPVRSYSFQCTANYIYSDLPASVEFLDKTNKRMTYENGMRNIFLKDVVVTAKKKIYRTPYERIPSIITIRGEDLKNTPMLDLPTYLNSRLPGVNFDIAGMANGIAIANTGDKDKNSDHGGIRIILNGFLINDQELALLTLQSLRIQDIAQIDYNRHAIDGLAWFPMTGASFIAITLKDGVEPYDYMPKNIRQIQLLGHQKPATFYSPKYETPEQRNSESSDLRTTIYWNPNIQTNKQGKTFLEFYTAEGGCSYSVVIEGLTRRGKLLRSYKKLIVGE